MNQLHQAYSSEILVGARQTLEGREGGGAGAVDIAEQSVGTGDDAVNSGLAAESDTKPGSGAWV